MLWAGFGLSWVIVNQLSDGEMEKMFAKGIGRVLSSLGRAGEPGVWTREQHCPKKRGKRAPSINLIVPISATDLGKKCGLRPQAQRAGLGKRMGSGEVGHGGEPEFELGVPRDSAKTTGGSLTTRSSPDRRGISSRAEGQFNPHGDL